MNIKSNGFRFEISLGLALIILVLVVLNFASHYALFRATKSLEAMVRDELSEAAVVMVNNIYHYETPDLPDSARNLIKGEYELDSLGIVSLNYARVMGIQAGEAPDSVILRLDRNITAGDLRPLLRNQTVFRHKEGDARCLLLFPMEYIGSKYFIAVSKESPLLGSMENAGRILIFFGILGVVIIIYVSGKFVHFITRPFNRLREKAVASGRLDKETGDEMTQLIRSYEKMIDDLRVKEQQLVALNDMVLRRAEDLEVYNNYILGSINTGIITFNSERRVATINRAAVTILNLQADKYGDAACTELLADFSSLLGLVEDFYATGKPIINSGVEILGEGRRRKLSVSLSPLGDSQGTNIGLSILFNDQTDFMMIQEELELNRRMASLGEMSGGLAHQLRNATAAIVGFARLIDRKTDADSPLKENVRSILKEAMETSALVGHFLDFARPLELSAEEFRPVELMKSVVNSAKIKYDKARIELDCDEDRELAIFGDQLLLKQALGNIVDNACRAVAESDGMVRVTARPNATMLEITIADNGPGIPDTYRDKIFTPFFSGTPSGSGLGLPLARKIITLHGGQITFESHPGRGTAFKVILPLKGIVEVLVSKREIAAQA